MSQLRRSLRSQPNKPPPFPPPLPPSATSPSPPRGEGYPEFPESQQKSEGFRRWQIPSRLLQPVGPWGSDADPTLDQREGGSDQREREESETKCFIYHSDKQLLSKR